MRCCVASQKFMILEEYQRMLLFINIQKTKTVICISTLRWFWFGSRFRDLLLQVSVIFFRSSMQNADDQLYQLIILAPSTVAIVPRQGSDHQQRQEDFICFSKKLGFALGPIQPHIPWILGVLSPGLQQLGCKTDHLPPPPPPPPPPPK